MVVRVVREDDLSPASPMIFWIAVAVHTQLRLSGLNFSLDSVPVRELAGWSQECMCMEAGGAWGGMGWGLKGMGGARQSQNAPHGGIAFAAAHCLHNREKNSLTAF